MSISPVTERLWWKTPMDREEAIWVTIAFVWCLFMFFMMPYWHVFGKQNLAHAAVKSGRRMSVGATPSRTIDRTCSGCLRR